MTTSSTALVWTNCRSPVDRSENRHGGILSWPRCTSNYIITGWPEKMSDDTLHPFFIRRHELSAEQGRIICSLRVVVPPNWRRRLIDDLHKGHMGMTRVKGVDRICLWWPGLDQDIAYCVRECAVCMTTRNTRR